MPKLKCCDLFETVGYNIRCPLLKKSCSKESEDWPKIERVPNIWIDHEDPRTLKKDDTQNDSEASGNSIS